MAGTTRSTGMHMEEELGMGMGIGMGMESMMCGDLFDQIEDLLDFPNDTDAEMMVDPSCNIDGLHCNIDGLPFPAVDQDELLLVPPPLQVESNGDFLPNQQSEINLSPPVDNTFNEEDDKVYENLEISDMDWFSNFIYDTADSFSLSFPADHISNNNSNNNMSIKEDSMFRTSSPVSVLEPNNSGAGGNGSSASSSSSSFSSSASTKKNVANNARTLSLPSNPLESAVPARSRNKRPRTTTFSPRPHVSISFLPPSPDSAPESFGESLASPMMFKKKKKATMLTEAPDCGTSISARKCTHCQIQKTPQWRAGPLGPKTLCNACGVRYKSGRLFPEYRPAASPTFIPAVHSNSHKKVVEIRLKTTTVPSREMSCDLLEYIRRREL